jgi:hypothetical protein
VIENKDAAAALACDDGSHEARCSGAEDQNIANLFVLE